MFLCKIFKLVHLQTPKRLTVHTHSYSVSDEYTRDVACSLLNYQGFVLMTSWIRYTLFSKLIYNGKR